MIERQRPVFRRRKIVAAGLGAAAGGLIGVRQASARTVLQRGMNGGGMLRFVRDDQPVLAHFSLFASSVQFSEDLTAVVGRIQWTEAGSGLVLESTEVNSCTVMPDNPGGRDVHGRMTVNGEGDYPFVMQLIDNGPPGTGQDSLTLEVGSPAARKAEGDDPSDTEAIYTVKARLVAGDLQWLSFDTPVDDGA
jgi:hypothetical protein